MSTTPIHPTQLIPSRLDSSRPVEKGPAAGESTSFSQWLEHSIATVDKMQQQSDAAALKLVTGQDADIPDTMIAMQKANITMDLIMEIRNKIISAYDEVKRMQF
jgi:flagellar hook-basal body complex protein FliE